jgi:adenosylcobinamide-GDP ribazoletransferase
VAVLEVILLVVMTGALHIDGLGDTADGLFSHRSRDKILEIMKDSRIGAMGVVAVSSIMAVKWAGLSELKDHRPLTLMLVPAYARCAILLAMRFLDYGRPGGGLGLPFFSRRLGLRRFWAMAVTLALSIGLGPQALWLNAAFFLIVAAVIGFYSRRLGCITGDMLGALTEVTEAALFLAAAAGGGR